MNSTPPNIVYLHSHDSGRYLQPYGHFIPTPNIQLLSDQGITFRQAFAAASTCSGSRASLVTGQYPHSNGMVGLAHRGFSLADHGRHILHPLRTAGYHSELIGEQHISENTDVLGYDRVHRIDRHHVDTVAPLAGEFLREQPPEPFFLSVGFFETHRNFFEPSSVRDTLYSLPPDGLPDLPEIRQDMAGFKASARSLDQGVGAVLNALLTAGLAERTLVIFTTDHGLAFPDSKATLSDRGTGVALIMRGPSGFAGGRVVDALVSQVDLYPTMCELAGVDTPEFTQGVSLMPLVRGHADSTRDEVFTELTYHAAYDPQRSIRTQRFKYIRRYVDGGPVLANCDDSPTKDLLVSLGWGERPIPRERLYDLALDPGESDNLAADERYSPVRIELAGRLDTWMKRTADPLRFGPVAAPPGARVNRRDALSPSEAPIVIAADSPPAAARSR